MLNRIAEAVRAGRRFLITSHVRLDGDAVGSELAFLGLLDLLGKQGVVYNRDETPGHYRFLPGSDRIVHVLPDPGGFDVVVVLDCSEVSRIGEEGGRIAAGERIVAIDHHMSNDGNGPLSYVDAEASSTGELVHRLVEAMGCEPTREMAVCLYTAILTDTGGFRYSNTGPECLRAAGRLVERGADPSWISENVYENNPPAKIRLLALALETLSFDCNGRLGSLFVSREHLRITGALPEHTDGVGDIPRTVTGVEISALCSEMDEAEWKVSLRSKREVDVERIARLFGGGGHRNAAAFRMRGDIESVRRRLVEVVGVPER